MDEQVELGNVRPVVDGADQQPPFESQEEPRDTPERYWNLAKSHFLSSSHQALGKASFLGQHINFRRQNPLDESAALRTLERDAAEAARTLASAGAQKHAIYTFEPLHLYCIYAYDHLLRQRIDELRNEEQRDGHQPVDATKLQEVATLMTNYSRLLNDYENSVRSWDSGLEPHDMFREYGTLREPPAPDVEDDTVLRSLLGVDAWFRAWSIWFLRPFVTHHGFAAPNLTKICWRGVKRGFVACAAGASLLVPVIIMTYITSRTARLIIISVAVVLFSFIMAATGASDDVLLTSTAAYAAVMVVFLGTAS